MNNKAEKENKQYTITLSERQLRLLAYACRVTDRLIIGQLDFIRKKATMSTEITFKNLSKAGFKKTCLERWQKDNVTIVTNRGSICERPFICYVCTGNNRYVKAMVPVETVEHFNQFMKLMNVDIKITED